LQIDSPDYAEMTLLVVNGDKTKLGE